MTYDLKFKDFSVDEEPVRFKVGADTFEAPYALPLPVMAELGDLSKSSDALSSSESIEKLLTIFDKILLEESATVFRQRVMSRDRPIGFKQLMDIFHWLLEVYGLRPTEPSSPSSTGLNDGGGTSTDGAQQEASTP